MNTMKNQICSMYQLIRILLILITIYIYSCGNPVTPTGGPKDTSLPKITKINIDSFGNYKTIRIDFNENITVKGQISISPLGKINTSVHRSSIQINVPKNTRTIYLQNKIVDLNESNPYLGKNIALTKDTGYVHILNKTKNNKITIFIKEDTSILLPNTQGNYYRFENLTTTEKQITVINKDNNNYIVDENEDYLHYKLQQINFNSQDTLIIHHLIPRIQLYKESKKIDSNTTLKIKSIRSYTTSKINNHILYQGDSCIEYRNQPKINLNHGKIFQIIENKDSLYYKEKHNFYDSNTQIHSPIVLTKTTKPTKGKTYPLGKLKFSLPKDSITTYYIYLKNTEYQFLLNINNTDSIYLPIGTYQSIVSIIPFDKIREENADEIILYNFKDDLIINNKLENNLILPKKELFNTGITYH